MIKTIIYTKHFRENLSKFKKLTPVASEIIEEKPEIPLELGPKPIDIEYSKFDRAFYLRPDLSAEIEKARSKLTNEIDKFEILKKEQSMIDQVKASQQNLQTLMQERDLRQKNPKICRKEKSDLLECLKTQQNCTLVLESLKRCYAA